MAAVVEPVDLHFVHSCAIWPSEQMHSTLISPKNSDRDGKNSKCEIF